MFIQIEKNPDGSHAFQIGGVLENGWAAIPENMELPKTFPFVNIEVTEVTHPAVTTINSKIVDDEIVDEVILLEPEFTQLEVVAMTEGEEIVLQEPEQVPTQLDIIEAQVTYTAMMTDTLLEG